MSDHIPDPPSGNFEKQTPPCPAGLKRGQVVRRCTCSTAGARDSNLGETKGDSLRVIY